MTRDRSDAGGKLDANASPEREKGEAERKAQAEAEARADGDADPEGLVWTHERSETLNRTRIFDVCRRWARAPDRAVEDFFVLEMPDWVQVLPLLPDGRFLMVEQFRHGTRRVTLEFPAGIIEPGESPIECARRELEEETGYVAGSAQLIGRVDANAALQDNELFMVVLRDCTSEGAMDPDPGERIRPRIVSPERVDELIENGEFREAYGIIAWDFYRRLSERD